MGFDASFFTTRTADGLTLSIQHVPAAGQSRGAVVLQHGLGANRLAFDFPGRSLSRYLAMHGFDCFIPELRGAGRSQRPAGVYGLDDYLEHDVPAILDAVRARSEQPSVHWVGHSMGGLLLMFHAIENPGAPIARFVAVGSALDYTPGYSAHRDTQRLRPLAGDWLKVLPFRRLSRLSAQVAGVGPLLPLEKMNFWRSNIERETMRHMLERGFTPIPMRLLDDLATTFSPQGFSRKGGSVLYLPNAHRLRVPTLLIGGSRDAQATDEAVVATHKLLTGAKEIELARFGKPHGHADDYGHIDLVIGRRAETEVWPSIANFLAR